VDEVHDDLAEALGIATDRREVRSDLDDEPQALTVGEQAQTLDRVHGDPPEIDVVQEEERAAALDPGEVEELVHHLDRCRSSTSILPDPVRASGAERRRPRPRIACQCLREETHRRERRAQLVGKVVDELAPDLLEAAELRHVSRTDPDAADGRAAGADDQRWARRRRPAGTRRGGHRS